MKKKVINVLITAHVDHGKTKLCDAIIEYCTQEKIPIESNTLDSHIIEKKRGVTIRNHFIKLDYNNIEINLIDSPGHDCFAQWVHVAKWSADVVILIIDVTQGPQPQTEEYASLIKVKKIIALNKIDIPHANVNEMKDEIKKLFSYDKIVEVSAYHRINIDKLIDSIIDTESKTNQIAQKYNHSSGLYILDCNSLHNGQARLLVQVINYKLILNDKILLNNKKYRINKLLVKKFKFEKEVIEINDDICYMDVTIPYNMIIDYIGHMITYVQNQFDVERVCREKIHLSYIGILCSNTDYEKLHKEVIRVAIGDPGVSIVKRFIEPYGTVCCCAFLGDFHRIIFLEKLRLESNIKFYTCYISPPYKYKDTGEIVIINYKNKILRQNFRKYLGNILSPFVRIQIILNQEYYSNIYKYLCEQKYFKIISFRSFINKFIITIETPFSSILLGLADKLKNITRGKIELLVEDLFYIQNKVSIIEFFINGQLIEETSIIETSDLAFQVAMTHFEKIKEGARRQEFLLKLHVSIDKKIVKSYVITPYSKNVTAKLYGGDITRSRKLLHKQKEGKIRLLKHADVSHVKKNLIDAIVKNSVM